MRNLNKKIRANPSNLCIPKTGLGVRVVFANNRGTYSAYYSDILRERRRDFEDDATATSRQNRPGTQLYCAC